MRPKPSVYCSEEVLRRRPGRIGSRSDASSAFKDADPRSLADPPAVRQLTKYKCVPSTGSPDDACTQHRFKVDREQGP